MLHTELQKEVAIVAINDMMKKSWFSICALDRAAKVLNMNISRSQSYAALHALHCVDFADMSPTLRRAIPEMIKDCFADSDVFQFPLPSEKRVPENVIDVDVINENTPGFWKRLISMRKA